MHNANVSPALKRVSSFSLGVDRLITEKNLQQDLVGKRLALLGNPASRVSPSLGLDHSLDALSGISGLQIRASFGPQHGMRGDKQDNMIETEDQFDEELGIPVFSLYGKVRRPTPEMMDTFDLLLIDVQDIGCRVYTFLTTLLYCLQACQKHRKQIWILDRPNPAGRPIEGHGLEPGWESFVGAAPRIPMRHGLTLGEAALWFQKALKIDVDLRVIPMKNYDPHLAPGLGWPQSYLPWINPSPNAATLNMARAYSGTVILEGTTLSEGRGTTRALEQFGAPDLPIAKILKWMKKNGEPWMRGAFARPCYFEPTFHKHEKKLVSGIHFHTDTPSYQHSEFKPYRWMALFLRAVREYDSKYPLWRDFPYEYVSDRLAVDVICGGQKLRNWVDASTFDPDQFERECSEDEANWHEETQPLLLYPRH